MSYSITTTADFFLNSVEQTRTLSVKNFFNELSIMKAWWQSHGEPQLQIVQFFDDDKLIGVLPLYSEDDGKALHFLGDQDVSDYLDIQVSEGRENLVFNDLGLFLNENQTWQTLRLISLPEHSPLRKLLPQIAQTYKWSLQETQQDVCPIIELPTTWEEYLAMIGKKQRHEITRKWKRLEEQGTVSFRVVTDTRNDQASLNTFFALHRLSSVEKAKFWTPEHEEYFKLLSTEASEHGWLRLYFLDFNGTPGAVMYCFAYEGQLLVYNSGFDPVTYEGKSVGNVLTAYTIQDAIKQQYTKYDFLRGGEEYKFRYRAVPHPVFNLELKRASDS